MQLYAGLNVWGVPCHWVDHCNGCDEFEFNDKKLSIYEKWFWVETGVSASISKFIL